VLRAAYGLARAKEKLESRLIIPMPPKLTWLAPVPKAQTVAAGFDHTLDKALMLNFFEMNLSKAASE
jgi:hypothetical protein